ncbi:peptidase inhibitor 15 [Callorhinchus milii]|uniref:R3H domain containing like n=1 Tax=Callorhinchus milii TaxID=7868 RepID=A0A4W3ILN7_CALMI|nr:peptidase inhibitor 15 [Callorhinchus milii]|eukprot:gi/632939339/ref/XP_007909678.1/ PREDICTED: peptidase inhibitor R3HDML [Callorhinchus milii]
MTVLHTCLCLTGLVLWIIQESSALVLSNVTELLQHNAEMEPALRRFLQTDSVPRSNRRKRHISQRDRLGILEYHNWVRSQVFPPAANMEYMIWDDRLAKSAEAWAAQCVWDHGPPSLMRYIGQNLSTQSGRYRSILDLVKSWYDEGRYYSYPHPRECNPRCPNKCSGAVCSHYTQMVWAASNRIGCAVHTCNNMNVWGASWRRTTFLVCNYSIKGNWIGEAPYKSGKPCSACPPSYGGSCSNNMCFPGVISNKLSFK